MSAGRAITGSAWMGITLCAPLVFAGCLVSVDHAATQYSCELSPECPPALECVGGVCSSAIAGPDAANVDATSQAPDAMPETLRIVVTRGSDDAEELLATGVVDLGSSDLEMTLEVDGDQIVGIRYQNIPLESTTLPAEAYLQFTTDEVSDMLSEFVIHAQAIADAPTFTVTPSDLSLRNRTLAQVTWSPPSWGVIGEADLAQRTPNLRPLLQEVLEQSDWNAGNSVVFIISGLGTRVASSFNGDPLNAAVLVFPSVP